MTDRSSLTQLNVNMQINCMFSPDPSQSNSSQVDMDQVVLPAWRL